MEAWIASGIYIAAAVGLWPLLWVYLGGQLRDPIFLAGLVMQLLNSYLVTMEQPPDFDLVISQLKTVQAHAQTLVAAAFAVAIFAIKAEVGISKWLPASLFCSMAVLLLFWLPYGDVVKYDLLRHLKTVVFTCGLFLLMKAVIETVTPKMVQDKPARELE